MKKENKSFEYEVYASVNELSEDDKNLMNEAKKALDKSYSPYSNFKVGAAVRLKDDHILSGANMENAAYPMCICAEGVVLSSVESNFPGQEIETMAITAKSGSVTLNSPPSPCGSCRQMISEKENRQKSPIRVILHGEEGPVFIIKTIKDILPFSFDGTVL